MISKKFVRLFACVLSLLFLLTCCVGCVSDDKQSTLDEHDYFFDPDTPKDENAITVAFRSVSYTALFIKEYMDKTEKTVNVVEYTYPDTYEQFNKKLWRRIRI